MHMHNGKVTFNLLKIQSPKWVVPEAAAYLSTAL